MSSNACQTESIDQQLKIFHNPIKDLSKNWEINISNILEAYLEKIDKTETNFQNKCSINFTEAALVVQGSVNIYCKKIEYLEKLILEVLNDFGRNKDNNCIIETENKKKRVKKMNSFPNELEFENLDDITIGKHIDMNDDDHFKESKLKFLPEVPIQLEKDENYGSQNIELLDKCEVVSSKADFYLNCCYLRPDGSLSITPLTNSFQSEPPKSFKTNGSSMVAEPALVYQDCSNGFNDPEIVPNDLEICNKENQTIAQNSNENIDEFQRIGECEVQPNTSIDLSNNISEEKDITIVIKLPNGKRSTLRKRTSVSNRQQPQPWIMFDPYSYSLHNREITRGKIRRLIPCTCHTTRQRKNINPGLYIRDKISVKSDLEPVDDYISKDIHKFCNKNSLKVLPEIIEAANKEREKRNNILKTRQATLLEAGEVEDQNISELRLALEQSINENIEDDYNQLLIDDDLQPLTTEISFEKLFLETAVPPDPIQTQINEENQVFEPITQEEWDKIHNHLYEPATMLEFQLQRKMAHHMVRAQESLNSNEIFQRVNKWKSSIASKLEIEENRKQFDIHAYGNEIIYKFAEIGETLSFEEVAKDFPQKDVSRVFLSCLMLGNSYNVNLHSFGGTLSMDDLMLTLLSQVQQHQRMEDYAFPSQNQVSPKRKRTAESMDQHQRKGKKKKVVSFAD